MNAQPTRRAVLFAGAVTTLGRRAGWALESSRTYRLGILSGGETRQALGWVVFFDEMGKAGFVEGRNLIVDWRFVGSPDQTGAAAAELVQLAPDVLIPAGSTPAITAAQQATRTIPLVGTADDMVGSGLVPSLAHPGGNLTGISFMATELDGKRLEILMELSPHGRARRPHRNRTASTRSTAKRCRIAWGRAVDLSGARRGRDRICREHRTGRRRHGAQRAGFADPQRQSQDHIGSYGRASAPRHVSMVRDGAGRRLGRLRPTLGYN